MKLTNKLIAIGVAILSIAATSCSGGGENSSGGSTPGPVPSGGSAVILSNITPIPTTGTQTNTEVIVNNSLNDNLILLKATMLRNDVKTEITSGNPIVDTRQCQTLQGRGSCSVGINAPEKRGNFLLSMNFADSKGNEYTTSQVITYTDQLPSVNGFTYSTLNNNIYKAENNEVTLVIPFVLDNTYANVSIRTGNPAITARVACPTDAYIKGSLCKAVVTFQNLGNIPLFNSKIIVSGTDVVSPVNKKGLVKKLNSIAAETGYEFSVPVIVSQNSIGNLITSAVNAVINPSDGAESHAQVVTLLNNGSATISNIQINPVTPINVINSGVGSCSVLGNSLTSGQSCTFKVNVNSSTSGQSAVALTYNNGASSGGTTGALMFNVVYISASPGPGMSFGSNQGSLQNVIVNTTQYYNIQVKNTGTVGLESIAFTNLSAPFSYESSGSSCRTDGTQGLTPQSLCTLIIKYSPVSTSPVQTLTLIPTAKYRDQGGQLLTYNGADISILYSAINGNAFFYITPNVVSFAIRANGQESVTQSFNVINGGGVISAVESVNLSSAVSGFSIISNGCASTSLNPESSCTITTKFGPTTTAISNATTKLQVLYKPIPTSPSSTSFSNITLNSSLAALLTVESVTVTGASSGAGTGVSPYLFTNSPESSINIVVKYKNIGTASAESFNVALNNLPVGYVKTSATCPTGSSIGSLAAESSCTVTFYAVDPNGLFNPYALNTSLNVNIPGYSYVDSSTGFNSNPFPVFGSYGNTINVSPQILASIGDSAPATINPGNTFMITFTASGFSAGVNSVGIVIPDLGTGGSISSGTNNCNISSGSGGACTITVNTSSNAPKTSYNYKYIVRPNSSSSGIIKYLTFTLQ